MSEESDPMLTFFTEKEAETPDFLYIVLGVKSSSTAGELRTAYRKAALRCHPDKHAGKAEAELTRMSAEFQRIGFAWAVLSDEGRRKM
jgi:DnaJ family protein C protein 9